MIRLIRSIALLLLLFMKRLDERVKYVITQICKRARSRFNTPCVFRIIYFTIEISSVVYII